MIHSELCGACGGPFQLGVGLVGPPKKDRKQSIKNKNIRFLSFHFDFLCLWLCPFVRLSVLSGFSLISQ